MLTRIFPRLAIGESYFGTANMGPSVESRPDAVDFNRLGHKIPDEDIEKAAQRASTIHEMGNPSERDVSNSRRHSSMLPPPASRVTLSTSPQATQQLQNWLGKEIGHVRTDTIETTDTTATTETISSRNDDTARSDSESTMGLYKIEES